MSNSAATYRDYLRLARLPNVFTAVADVTMGFLFVQGTLHPPLVFGCLLAASVLLYTSGMVLNDVWDVEQDRRERQLQIHHAHDERFDPPSRIGRHQPDGSPDDEGDSAGHDADLK